MNVTIRDWTFTHFWVRPVVKVWFDFYHKSVSYSGTGHIDWDKPIIFAASHQSAFTDALCLILPTRYVNDRFIYPLVRADAFGNNRLVDWVLTSFHMMPVYRPKDKVDIKKRNETVFRDCYSILSKNRNLLIHPEGNCFPIKKVRRFKKGLARIAFGAEMINDFELDTEIIPVGINYRKSTKPRSGIHVRFGKPVSLKQYEKAYREHEAAAIADLTAEIEQRVKDLTVDIQLDDSYRLIEELLQLSKQMIPSFVGSEEYSVGELRFEKKIVSRSESVLGGDKRKAGRLERCIEQLRTLLKKQELDENHSLQGSYSLFQLAVKGSGFIIMLPFFLFGWINNLLPWYLIHHLAGRIQDTQFINSARMAMGLLAFPLFYVIQTLFMWIISGSLLWTTIYFISLPISGVMSLKLSEKWKEWRQQFKLRFMSAENSNRLAEVRDELFNILEIEV
ncbi:MAG: 1-acyl-sn-glycerol-3-phosphate acyltransferase [Balneolaceae bacterium]|nr:1-acyl-sn-glycerol-3-phosphate acyltransferase [Balneolaceae bacterium]